MFSKKRKRRLRENIIIVGLGPAGLAAAIEACQSDSQHRKVIAFTDRTDYTRNQIFRLDDSTLSYLKELLGEKVIDNLFKEKQLGTLTDAVGKKYHVIKIHRLEEVLFNKLSEYKKEVEMIYADQSNGNRIESIDENSRAIILANGKKIRFKYLLGTDGAHHSTSNLLNKNLNHIIYDKTQMPMLHRTHIIANFHLPTDKDAAFYEDLLSKHTVSYHPNLKKLKSMGWEHLSAPETRIFVIEDTLYIGTECPEKFSQETRALESWASEILSYYLPNDAIDTLSMIEAKHNLAKFSITLDEANCTIIPIQPTSSSDKKPDESRTSYFLNMSDSLKPPQYHTGSGAVFALKQCANFGKFLKSSQSAEDLQLYHCDTAIMRFENRERIDKHLADRTAREHDMSQGREDRRPRIHGF